MLLFFSFLLRKKAYRLENRFEGGGLCMSYGEYFNKI